MLSVKLYFLFTFLVPACMHSLRMPVRSNFSIAGSFLAPICDFKSVSSQLTGDKYVFSYLLCVCYKICGDRRLTYLKFINYNEVQKASETLSDV